MNPTFSIIMTSYNYAPYIAAAIESVLCQTFEDWEMVIIDDCSHDCSWEIIEKYRDPRISVHRQLVNQGACAAYNRGFSLAQGENIACLDSDDVFMPCKLARQAEFLVDHPEVDICGTFVTEIDRGGLAKSQGNPFADWFNALVDLNDPATWLWENHLCHSGSVIRRKCHARIGEFDNHLVYTPDWQFWLRALLSGARFEVIDEPLVGYRNHGNNITDRNVAQAILEHAETAASILLPWLRAQGRRDLIDKTLLGFLTHPAVVSENALQDGLEQRLLVGSALDVTAAAIMRLAIRFQTELFAKEAYVLDVREGKDWLESEWKATKAELLAKDAQLAAVLAGTERDE
ncbi:MAG: glycosyltransferase [Candidatus Accumulibacter sp.]|jgi:glycosyltransferase involved in cell wall biosynthesis|uniref:Glycosyltransferase n=1 Tax=Candidatus Accumulibacter affinis TaxID=2954384 RepID=A0A935TA87_9PROT|nr:glycosyltransferase [Candidatus Accumulibacter affinis]